MPSGRPSIYTEELAELICERVATSTFGLKKLCSMYDDMPNHDTVFAWRYKNRVFSDLYTKAKIAQAELLAEETLDISDDGTNDWMETLPDKDKPEGWKLNGEHVNRSRLRIETRKFLAAKLMPKIYGNQAEKSDDDNSAKETQRLINERTLELLNAQTK
jgi:hypothetical protein